MACDDCKGWDCSTCEDRLKLATGGTLDPEMMEWIGESRPRQCYPRKFVGIGFTAEDDPPPGLFELMKTEILADEG